MIGYSYRRILNFECKFLKKHDFKLELDVSDYVSDSAHYTTGCRLVNGHPLEKYIREYTKPEYRRNVLYIHKVAYQQYKYIAKIEELIKSRGYKNELHLEAIVRNSKFQIREDKLSSNFINEDK